ncbi:hypothetical protein BDW66DRAFT_165244 [Aspergillus desertorum]
MALQSLRNGWTETADFIQTKLRDEVNEFLRKHADADLFIVTGPAGVGKSSFIKSVTGENVYVGSTLKSGTTTTSLVPAVIGNKRCLFLDMPGFNTRDFDDWDIFQRVMIGLSVVQPYVQFRGVLYVDAMEDNRVTDAAEKILSWLYYFCGTQFMPNVTIVTTWWDNLNDDGIETKLARFEKWKGSDLFQRLFVNGAAEYHHGLYKEGTKYSTLHLERKANQRRLRAREMIAARYEGRTTLRLQIHIEIENGATLEATEAGKWLRYGHARRTQPNGDSSANATPGNSSTDNDSERDSESDMFEPDTAGSWGEQFSGFWSNPERIKPWAQLLLNAVKLYMSASSRPDMASFPTSGGSWALFDDPPDFDLQSPGDDYCFPAGIFDEDTLFEPIPDSKPDCLIL